MIVVVDYGLGNLNSIVNMIKKAGGVVRISSHAEEIRKATQLILPGVGAFDNGMKNLHDRGIAPVLNEMVMDAGTPVLGICLGMQLMTRASEEGSLPGLGWFEAETRKFCLDGLSQRLKVPNMGWRSVRPWKEENIFKQFTELPSFYFVHSYHCVCARREDILASAHYGYEFCCGIHRNNIWGVQFHPEKSHKFGLALLTSFLQLNSPTRLAA